MFSLIISIISIALVAALAAATVYFGGAAFNKGTAGADASTFINAGQQVAGAFTLAAADGVTAANVAALNPNYLAQIPSFKGVSLELSATTGLENYVTVTGANKVSDGTCDEITTRTGVVAPAAESNVISGLPLFACIKGATDDLNKAYYKVK